MPVHPPRAHRGTATTLADVARSAGVSVSTAGRVLRDDGWPVEEALKRRVLAAAEELSYVRNAMARTLRGGAPALVGLVIGNMLDPYYGEIGEAVTRYSETSNKMPVMVCNMQRDPKLELEYCKRLWEHRVAGLILAGGGFDQFTYREELATLLERMERSGVVVTTLSPRELAPAAGFHVDNVQVGRLAASELLVHGHRRLGLVVGPIHNRVLQQRVDGAMARCAEAGIECHLAETDSFGPAWIARTVAQLFEAHPDITGIVAASGVTSLNATHAVTATGRSVPGDVSVIGVGGEAIAQWCIPEITRVDLALDVCGRAALDYIAARVNGATSTADFSLEPRIVSGGSVAALG
ncbi:MAG: LacI family DNA-binding transcriptional regulator [Pseudomonadota bacterium]